MSSVKTLKIRITVNGTREITGSTRETILASLAGNGVILEAICGGYGTCGKCQIKVISGAVANDEGFPVAPDRDGFYLACQVYPVGDLSIETGGVVGVCAKGKICQLAMPEGFRVAPVQKCLIKPAYPTLGQNYSLQEMIDNSLGRSTNCDIQVLKKLALIAPAKAGEITLICNDDWVMGIENGDTTSVMYGVAFDIGTTTVAGMLVDLNKGEVVAAAAETNPQVVFGADVVSRIKAAATPEGLAKQSDMIRECLNIVIGKLCMVEGITSDSLYVAAIVGNSAMEHLLMGISPVSLTLSPYVTVFKALQLMKPEELDLAINPGGRVFLLTNIASFVGADTVAAVMAVDQDIRFKYSLLIDLGTNGEIVLGNTDKLLVSSTAAGPAFEGAQLS